VQAADLADDQLRHRRATLPERAALAEEEHVLSELDAQLAPVRDRGGALGRSQRRLEDEIETLEAKAKSEDATLYSGRVRAPRELQALQEEVAGLRRRARQLEDQLLDILEEAESVAAEVGPLEARRLDAAASAERLRAAIAESEAAIDGELAEVARRKEAAARSVPAELGVTYGRLRRRLGGVVVARLEGNRCGGCHLTLPAAEVDAARRAPASEVVRHDECGRILVRD
jgi:uncharacterized protein